MVSVKLSATKYACLLVGTGYSLPSANDNRSMKGYSNGFEHGVRMLAMTLQCNIHDEKVCAFIPSSSDEVEVAFPPVTSRPTPTSTRFVDGWGLNVISTTLIRGRYKSVLRFANVITVTYILS